MLKIKGNNPVSTNPCQQISSSNFQHISGDFCGYLFSTEHLLSLQQVDIYGLDCKFKVERSWNIVMIVLMQVSAT